MTCTDQDIHQYNTWYTDGESRYRTRWYDMVLFTRMKLNPPYTTEDIYQHEQSTMFRTWDRKNKCTCQMCLDHYNPKGFREYPDLNYEAYIKIHGLFSDNTPIETPITPSETPTETPITPDVIPETSEVLNKICFKTPIKYILSIFRK
jgi:hypothetical protein